MQQKDNDQFSFINEKIKEKPVNKKRLLMQAGFIARGGTGGHHSAGFGCGDGAD